jgi:hypothetical protein
MTLTGSADQRNGGGGVHVMCKWVVRLAGLFSQSLFKTNSSYLRQKENLNN